ncbi:hypothetical protein BDZ89DRAFT_717249 [Hymenopellis radicata]|nr:hypothetical protein BDZ89DRAFT_717249 [Hymenopellis radicata]
MHPALRTTTSTILSFACIEAADYSLNLAQLSLRPSPTSFDAFPIRPNGIRTTTSPESCNPEGTWRSGCLGLFLPTSVNITPTFSPGIAPLRLLLATPRFALQSRSTNLSMAEPLGLSHPSENYACLRHRSRITRIGSWYRVDYYGLEDLRLHNSSPHIHSRRCRAKSDFLRCFDP